MKLKLLEAGQCGHGLLVEQDAGRLSIANHNSIIKESAGSRLSPENPIIYAVLQKHGIVNKNGRIYPKAILEREVKKYAELIKMGASVGETDHADTSVISINNVSILILETWWEGVTLLGKILLPITRGYVERGIISHPADKLFHDINAGIQYGISSRGVGSVKKEGQYNVVQEDFEILCWDAVTNPSTNGSWLYGNKANTAPHVESFKKEVPTHHKALKSDRIADGLKNYLSMFNK